MAASLIQLSRCIGLKGPLSVLGGFYGFFQGVVPPDPVAGANFVSLLQQARLLRGPHFHLNVILVGFDNFTAMQLTQVDYCIHRIRTIYSQIGAGVGRVEHYVILAADAEGFDTITTESQIDDLSNRWRVPNDGIDVFIPQSFNVPSGTGVLLGKSAKPGPCEGMTNPSKDLNGSVIGPQTGNNDGTARTFSHEVGHYFGLEHRNTEPNNLMCQTRSAGPVRTSILLDTGQGDDIKKFCLIRAAC